MEKDFMTPIGEVRLQNGSRLLFCYGVKDFSPLPDLLVREKTPLASVDIFHLHKQGYGRANFVQVSESNSNLHCPDCGTTLENLRGDVRTIGDLARALKSTVDLPRSETPHHQPEA
ncbi:MAG: hypothetical protein Q7S86_02920 [bacterium]|nr:hypothetical protein [bacterium]